MKTKINTISSIMNVALEELEQLLAESPAAARDRAANPFLSPSDKLVLYGAGQLGLEVAEKLRSVDLPAVAFADDTPDKQGTKVAGLQVMSPAEAATTFGDETLFVITILNLKLRFLQAQRRLKTLTGKRVISFLQIAWIHPDVFLPHYQFVLPEDVLVHEARIREAFHLFADDESRRQYVAHLKFRLRLDFEALPTRSDDGYFPGDLIAPLPENTVYVDCGAFDGDTVRRFLAHQQNRFGKIYAFEPDETNCLKLQTFVDGLGTETASRITVYHAGVGDVRKKLRFSATGNMSSSFDAAGNNEVDVLPLQEIVKSNGAPIYLKFDVEGAEWDALKGARELLNAHPILAISAYHRPNDLWELPLYLASLKLGYKFFLRTHGEDGMDAVCYAIPSQATTN
ncbi:MAG: FkbM family methyltransferase [Acidobacteriota bacterium]